MAPNALLLFIVFFAYCAASTQTDLLNCKEVQCPPIPEIQCPPDSVSSREKKGLSDQHTTNFLFKDDYVVNNIKDGDYDVDKITTSYSQPLPNLNNFDGDNSGEVSIRPVKRSLQYKRRESIKIVPGHYISLVPEIERYHHVAVNYHKSKRDVKHEITTSSAIADECCPPPECTCIGDCQLPQCEDSSHVLLEIKGKSGKPGECCPQYQCINEPKCTKRNISWIKGCQTCQCRAGYKICHNSCSEMPQLHVHCYSVTLRKPILNGNHWKEDDCTNCVCVNGDSKCQTSSCSPLHCSNKIKLSGECCPFCLSTTTELPEVTQGSAEVDANISLPISPSTTTETMSTTSIPTSTPTIANISTTEWFEYINPSPTPSISDTESKNGLFGNTGRKNETLLYVIIIGVPSCVVVVIIIGYLIKSNATYQTVPNH